MSPNYLSEDQDARLRDAIYALFEIESVDWYVLLRLGMLMDGQDPFGEIPPTDKAGPYRRAHNNARSFSRWLGWKKDRRVPPTSMRPRNAARIMALINGALKKKGAEEFPADYLAAAPETPGAREQSSRAALEGITQRLDLLLRHFGLTRDGESLDESLRRLERASDAQPGPAAQRTHEGAP